MTELDNVLQKNAEAEVLPGVDMSADLAKNKCGQRNAGALPKDVG